VAVGYLIYDERCGIRSIGLPDAIVHGIISVGDSSSIREPITSVVGVRDKCAVRQRRAG